MVTITLLADPKHDRTVYCSAGVHVFKGGRAYKIVEPALIDACTQINSRNPGLFSIEHPTKMTLPADLSVETQPELPEEPPKQNGKGKRKSA